jgi:hypothetical protein
MSRRIPVLAAVCAIGAAAANAWAAPPGGGIPPVNPPAVGLCAQLPHPTPACRAVTVACLATCTTTGSTGPANADVRKLGLQLPRRYARAVLSCKAVGDVSVSCRLVSRTLVGATGVHVAVMKLPQSFDTVRISCTSRTKLVCVVKRVS